MNFIHWLSFPHGQHSLTPVGSQRERGHTHTHTANLWVLPLPLAGPSAWLDQIRGLLVWMCEGNVRGLWVWRRGPARQKPIDSWTSKKGERSKCIFLHSSKTSSNKRQISFHGSVSVFACAIFITPTCLWLQNLTISNWVKRTNSWLIKHFNYNHTVQILERAFLLQEQQLSYIHSRGERRGWTFNCTNFLQHTERHQDDSTWVNAQKQKHFRSSAVMFLPFASITTFTKKFL